MPLLPNLTSKELEALAERAEIWDEGPDGMENFGVNAEALYNMIHEALQRKLDAEVRVEYAAKPRSCRCGEPQRPGFVHLIYSHCHPR